MKRKLKLVFPKYFKNRRVEQKVFQLFVKMN